MEVHDAFIFTGSCLAGPAASVACRSLGFTTGAPLFVPGPLQAISTPASENSRIQSIQCQGSEQSLQDCEIQGRTEAPFDPFQEDVRVEACSVACSIPTGAGLVSACLSASRRRQNKPSNSQEPKHRSLFCGATGFRCTNGVQTTIPIGNQAEDNRKKQSKPNHG